MDNLPVCIKLQLLEAVAVSSPRDMCALAASCSALYKVYRSYETLILKPVVKDSVGIYFPFAFIVGKGGKGDPSDDPQVSTTGLSARELQDTYQAHSRAVAISRQLLHQEFFLENRVEDLNLEKESHLNRVFALYCATIFDLEDGIHYNVQSDRYEAEGPIPEKMMQYIREKVPIFLYDYCNAALNVITQRGILQEVICTKKWEFLPRATIKDIIFRDDRGPIGTEPFQLGSLSNDIWDMLKNDFELFNKFTQCDPTGREISGFQGEVVRRAAAARLRRIYEGTGYKHPDIADLERD